MVLDSLDAYIETLSGYIYDDDKLVTYKWLSKELEIHVNITKQVLWEFWQRYRKEKDLEATFMLIGYLEDGEMRIEVVKESHLAAAKHKFTKLISEHLYSLQKTLPDLELLAMVDDGDCQYSAIKCKEAVIRSDDELLKLRWGTQWQKVKQTDSDNKDKKQVAGKIESKVAEKTSIFDKKGPAGKKPLKTQKGALNNFFSKVDHQQVSVNSTSPKFTEKAEEKKNGVNNVANNKTSKTAKSPPTESKNEISNAFNSMFGKMTGVSSKETDSKDAKNAVTGMEVDSPSMKESPPVKKSSLTNDTMIENNKNVTNSKKATKTNKSASKLRGKKRQRSGETHSAEKKRKRITVISDSSEEEEESQEEEKLEEDIVPEEVPSPAKTTAPSPPLVKIEQGKRKVRKMVDSTFADEDGYLVTKKVPVYESCSDEENEVTEIEKPKPVVHKKNSKNTKQTAITNFFTKS